MASKTKHTSDPAAMTLRVGIIEWRDKGKGRPWNVYANYIGVSPREDDLVWYCRELSERYTGCELRYRAATLTFDDDGSKATIY